MQNSQINRFLAFLFLFLFSIVFSECPELVRRHCRERDRPDRRCDTRSYGPDYESVSGFSRTATTDSKGQFQFFNIPFSPYRLAVTARALHLRARASK